MARRLLKEDHPSPSYSKFCACLCVGLTQALTWTFMSLVSINVFVFGLLIYLCLVSSVYLLVFDLLLLSTGFWSFLFIYLHLVYSFVYLSLVSSCPLIRFFRLSTCVGLLLLSNLFLVSSHYLLIFGLLVLSTCIWSPPFSF